LFWKLEAYKIIGGILIISKIYLQHYYSILV